MSNENKLPAKIFHKAWRESFELHEIGRRIGYGNNEGWLIVSGSKDELLSMYMELVKSGVISEENSK